MPAKFLALALLALLAAPALAAEAQSPDADQLLRRMSAKLAAAKSFTFTAQREIDAALIAGRDLPERARVTVAVQRPGQFTARAVSKDGARRFVADGRTLTLLDETKNVYATAPMPATLDALVAQLDAKYGFTPPLAEFALSDPYANFRREARTVTYLGREKVSAGFLGLGSIECDRLALNGKEADAELWIAVGDSLPRKLVATFHRDGQPQVRIAFSAWNLAAPTTAGEFAFTPPEGAEKIEMWTTARMESAGRKATTRKP
jgi:hypothetical protein